MTKIRKNDFIEIEFTGLANGEIFDTTNKKDAEKMGIEPKNIKPLTISVGNQMILQGLDEDLEGKETGKEYSIHILPEKAFALMALVIGLKPEFINLLTSLSKFEAS